MAYTRPPVTSTPRTQKPITHVPAESLGDAADRAPARVLLVEVAWEVCNQVGGIYQVLRSKAPTMASRWRSRYCMVGPYYPGAASAEFEPLKPAGWVERVIQELADEGIRVHHGRWLVAGSPRVFLVEHEMPVAELDRVKARLWSEHRIGVPMGDHLVDEVIMFGERVRRLFESICRQWAARGAEDTGDRRVLGHFHEWMSGLGLVLLSKYELPLDTVFTTHATLVGRYAAHSEEDFYARLMSIDGDETAERYGIVGQHAIERACAATANVMTTVSAITAEECRQFLGRQPDFITANGLNVDSYDVGHDFQTLHAEYKERIHEFVLGHFFPTYSFDLDRTLYFFTSGRFEHKNKGFDVCLDAMAHLNKELKSQNVDVTVVFFLVTQVPVVSLHPRAIERRAVLEELHTVCRHIAAAFGERLFRAGAAGSTVRPDELIDEYWKIRFRRVQQALRSNVLPPTVTHVLKDEKSDPVLGHIQYLGLNNDPGDRVKIVYHPQFISPVNPLWGIEYEHFVRGCHLGIFPSAYEPYGYTPLECVAMGVPAVTSDVAGFGRYVMDRYGESSRWGLTVLRRRGRSFHETSADLTRYLLEYCRLGRKERVALRNEVVHRARDFDWSLLAAPYHRAHALALTLR